MAHPWWVNLLITVPFISYVFWQRASISVRRTHLLAAALFAASFGVVEGTVVVYLRAVLGAAAGYNTSLSGVAQFSESLNQVKLEPTALPPSLLKVEVFREAATIFMLVSVGLLAAPNRQGRWAMFLWTFAIWDVTYYVTLRATIRWPSSITDNDVLFLIPVVWVSPVWFPLLGEHSFCWGGSAGETTYPSPGLEYKARTGVSELKLDRPLKIVLQNC